MQELIPGSIRKFKNIGIGIVIETGPIKYLVVNESSNENYVEKTEPYEEIEVRPEIATVLKQIFFEYLQIKRTTKEIERLKESLKDKEQNLLDKKTRLRDLAKSLTPKEFEEIVIESLTEKTKEKMKKYHYFVKIRPNFENFYELSIQKNVTVLSKKEIEEMDMPNKLYDFIYFNANHNLKMKAMTENFCKIRNECYKEEACFIESNDPEIQSRLREDTILKVSNRTSLKFVHVKKIILEDTELNEKLAKRIGESLIISKL